MQENQNENENKFFDDDSGLIQDFIDGDDHAFSKLVAKHKEKVRNLVYLT